MSALFDPMTFGAIQAPNRILMAPLTRGRAGVDHVPTPMMADYYAQRAGAGLIISEATGISREGLGWPKAPGIWSAPQREAWARVVDAVHAAGGRIVCQLWHMGHLVHPLYLDGQAPVSVSRVTAPGRAHTYEGRQDYVEARELSVSDIQRVVEDYARAARNARNARAAGFDGVQVHGANGYLVDSFLRDSVNRREDDYGGSPENRIRFLGEVVRAVSAEVGSDRTAVRLSPNGDTQGVIDSDPATVFGPAAALLDTLDIAFLELREPGPEGTFGSTEQPKQSGLIRRHFGGPLVLNSDLTARQGSDLIEGGRADAVSFGRPFIANPDFVERARRQLPLAQGTHHHWYGPDEHGYSDWPVWAEAAVEA